MLFKLAFKSVISRRSSAIIILFITFAVCLFCVANAVFDSTEHGVQTNYKASFTGDCIIRPQSKMQQSLFGDETPVTGELTVLSTLVPYSDIIETLKTLPEVEAFTGQVSGAVMAERSDGANRIVSYLFGVNAQDYLSLMKSIKIINGAPFEEGQRGVMLCKQVAQKLDVTVGSMVQFVVADGPNFRIRAATVTAIFEYDIYNEIFGRFIIADPVTVRSVMDMTETFASDDYEIAEENTNLFLESDDFDDLFSDAADFEYALESVSKNEETDSDDSFEPAEPENAFSDSTTWNYLLIRLKPTVRDSDFIKKINRIFRKKGWPVQATDWRHAAGSTALYLFWMRKIFNIGIMIVLAAGFIIVNNSLIINVLDRTREIGTLRAIGAKKRFISLQCMIENIILTFTSGILGVIAGKICVHFINKAHIILSNSFLIQLFGSEALSVSVTGLNVFKLFVLVTVLALLGWVYPVINALKVSPVDAIQGAK